MTTLEKSGKVTSWAGNELPEEYVALLMARGGQFCGELVRLYDVDEIIERNETYETKTYCPGFLTIGDDRGGRAVVIASRRAPSPVYLVDHGYMSPDGFATVASDDCPVHLAFGNTTTLEPTVA